MGLVALFSSKRLGDAMHFGVVGSMTVTLSSRWPLSCRLRGFTLVALAGRAGNARISPAVPMPKQSEADRDGCFAL